MTNYGKTFFDYVNSGAIRSARRVIPLLLAELEIASVLDIGCGQGAWLSVWKELGVESVSGIDGDYVDRDCLLISPKDFIAHDLVERFDLQRRFDLVVTMEVAEHLPEECNPAFVKSLVRHGDLVLFSAAPKGQGGHNHINEQDYEYWRKLFSRHGYVAVDYLRPLLIGAADVETWYRYNPVMYASPQRFIKLPEAVQCCRVDDDVMLKDFAPVSYRLRKALVRLLPVTVMTSIAKIKETLVVRNGS